MFEKLNDPTARDGIDCQYCGKEFKKRPSVRGRQVIWVRLTLRITGHLFQLHGAVCATCRDKLAEFQISDISRPKELVTA